MVEELVGSDMVNARNLTQLLWSLGKLGDPERATGEIRRHPDTVKGLREIGPLRFGSRRRGQESEVETAEVPPSDRVGIAAIVCFQSNVVKPYRKSCARMLSKITEPTT